MLLRRLLDPGIAERYADAARGDPTMGVALERTGRELATVLVRAASPRIPIVRHRRTHIHSTRHEALRALLVEERKAAGLTQAVVAEKLGRYQSFMAAIESGQRRIDVIEFLDLAKAIGFSAEVAIGKLAQLRRR